MNVNERRLCGCSGGGGGGGGANRVPALAAPRTSIDLTSLVSPFSPPLFYFPPIAAAYAHFLPSLIDAPSVDDNATVSLVHTSFSLSADRQRTLSNISSMSVSDKGAGPHCGFTVVSAMPSRRKTCVALSRHFQNILVPLPFLSPSVLTPACTSSSPLLWPRHRNARRRRRVSPKTKHRSATHVHTLCFSS